MKRFTVLIAGAFIVALLVVPATAHAAYTTNAECLTCHDQATGSGAVSRVDFASGTTVDYTKCRACHWIPQTQRTHGNFTHGHAFAASSTWGGYDCVRCHRTSANGYADMSRIMSVSTADGWFATADPRSLSASALHAIHVNGSWPKTVKFTKGCSSCHEAAACTACHTAPPAAHTDHTKDPDTGVWVYPALGYRVGNGTPVTMPDLSTVTTSTVTCVNASCHARTAVGTTVFDSPSCPSCHTDKQSEHGYGSIDHVADNGAALEPGSTTACGACHATDLMTEHAKPTSTGPRSCATCHASPRNTFGAWDQGCDQCHGLTSSAPKHDGEGTKHDGAGVAECTSCHDGSLDAIHAPATTVIDTITYTACPVCHNDATSLPGKTCVSCHFAMGEHPAPAAKHTATASPDCATCHDKDDATPGTDIAAVHGTLACGVCHNNPTRIGTFSEKTAECASCHADKMPLETGHYPAPVHAGSDGSACTGAGCHDLGLAPEHAKPSSGPISCAGCHVSSEFAAMTTPWDGDCDACHATKHSSLPVSHASSNGSDYVSLGMSDGDHSGYGWYLSCSDCHPLNLLPLHMNDCGACHASTARAAAKTAVASSDTACTSCHPGQHYGGNGDHESIRDSNCDNCHDYNWNVDCWGCHGPWAPDPVPSTTSDAKSAYVGAATINLTASDDYFRSIGIKATYYILDGGQRVAGARVIVPDPGTGSTSHTLRFWSTDWSGITESAHEVTFTVSHDTFPPVTTSNVVPGSLYTGDKTFTLTPVDADSTVAGTWWQLNSTAGAWTSGMSVPVSGPATGTVTHTLFWYSRDSLGNTEATKSVTFRIAAGREYSYTGAIQTFVVPSGVTTINVTLNGGAGGDNYYVPYYGTSWGTGGLGGSVTATIPVTPLSTLTVYAGGAGAQSYYNSPGGWPNGAVGRNYCAGGGGGSSSIWSGATELAEAGGGGGAGHYYAGAAGGAGGSQGTLPGGFRAGTASFYSEAGGGGGGWNAGAGGPGTNRGGTGGTSYIAVGSGTLSPGANVGNGSVSIRYVFPGPPDLVPPVTTASFNPAAGTDYGAAQPVTLTAVDASSGIKATYYRIDEASYSTGTTFTVSGDGLHTFSYYSVDTANNTETVKTSNQFRVDTTAPSTSIDAVNGQTYTGHQTFRLTATDTGSGVANSWYRVDSGAWATGTVLPVDAPASGSAGRTVYFYSRDNAGRTETTKSVTFTVAARVSGEAPIAFSALSPAAGTTTTTLDPLISVMGTADQTITAVAATLDGQATATGLTYGPGYWVIQGYGLPGRWETTTTTIVGTFVGGNQWWNKDPSDLWWGADWIEEYNPDTNDAWTVSASFDLTPFGDATFTGASLAWTGTYGGAGGGPDVYIRRTDTAEILQAWDCSEGPTSSSAGGITSFLNARKNGTATFLWDADHGDAETGDWGIEQGMASPRLTFTCEKWVPGDWVDTSYWVPAEYRVATAGFATGALAEGSHTASFTFTTASGGTASRSWRFAVELAAPANSQAFAFTGADQTFTVPAGVTTLTVDLHGAEGGAYDRYSGGGGGGVHAAIPVTPGQVLTVRVGAKPGDGMGMPGGWPNGGRGEHGGAGGGSTAILSGGSVWVEAGAGGGADHAGSDGGDGGQQGWLPGGNRVGGSGGGGAAGGGGWNGGGGAAVHAGSGDGGTSYIAVGSGTLTLGEREGHGSARIRWNDPDMTPPTGSVSIAAGATVTRSTSAALTMSATDPGGSGVSLTRFSNDDVTWTDWEDYATVKDWTLAAGDGPKSVYVQYMDNAGNVSSTANGSIVLDTAAPSGTMALNGAAATTTSRDVSVDSAVSDSGSGLSRMRIDPGTGAYGDWITPYVASTGITLPEGYGLKTVRVEYEDGAGNALTLSDSITLQAPAPTTGTLAGHVTGTGGVDISGAAVTTDGGRTTTTDGSGDYSFASLPPGAYSVTVAKTGYVTKVKSGTVTAGSETTVDFALSAPTSSPNLVHGKTFTASVSAAGYAPSLAGDDDPETFWWSNPTGAANAYETFQVDLGAPTAQRRYEIVWDAARYAKSFAIQVSDNGTSWGQITSQSTASGATYVYTRSSSLTTRYVRVICRATSGVATGYAIKEFRIFN
jgi:hypothetical protein